LHTWLPDAMEGPTPVSALIHAATMVTAGVFMVCRLSPIMEYASFTPNLIVIIGSLSAFFAASVALVQTDIKRVIAYSTCSQLGYMFVAAGLGAYPVAMYHLFTHAFFKALLFLGAGSVIHAMHHQQDMRSYGGLRHKIPYSFAAMLIGTLAITGVGIPLSGIGFAGFFSKDAIIESAFAGGNQVAHFAFYVLVVTAFMTAFYSWRLIFLTFFGKNRGDAHSYEHAHESPLSMLIPLGLLALGAIFSGIIWYQDFFGKVDHIEAWFGISVYMNHDTNHIIHDAHYVPTWIKLMPFIVMVLGLFLAYMMYIVYPHSPSKLAKTHKYLYAFLLNKWYFDELFDHLFIRPAKYLGRVFWRIGDGFIIDGLINTLAMGTIPELTKRLTRMQSGYIFHYAFVIVIGVAILITMLSLEKGLG